MIGTVQEFYDSETSGTNRSSWFANANSTKFQRLDRKLTVDTVIIGAGISGITTAYVLTKAGQRVAVVDDGYVGSGETGRTTAHLTHALDDRYYTIEKRHGQKFSSLAAQSHTEAIDTIEKIVESERINCDFERVNGYLFLDPTDKRISLKRELDATHNAGINSTSLVDNTRNGKTNLGPSIEFPEQAQFQPLKYLAGLSKVIVKSGGEIFTETHASIIKTGGITSSTGYKISAKNVVLATNGLVHEYDGIYHKQVAHRTYVIAARIRKNVVGKALYWDTGNMRVESMVPPYHYVRIQKLDNNHTNDLLIVGGEDHRTGYGNDYGKRFAKLEQWTREHFPIDGIEYRWSGQIMEPQDSMAFIGKSPKDPNKNIFIATGDSGNGMTHGTIAGLLLSDLILGKDNPYEQLYSPLRKIQSPRHPPEDDQVEPVKMRLSQLGNGQGMIIEKKRRAVYKTKNGDICSFSAACMHHGCTIVWNSFEQSFDCPCHGSRYAPDGTVVNGPANQDLEAEQLTDDDLN
jgi:glycine/D-amino acid oxidase-like deaminating enzyme/nitrite reductase/ring-hydroxylating ferredoxin subunit